MTSKIFKNNIKYNFTVYYKIKNCQLFYHDFFIVALELKNKSASKNDIQMVTALFFCSLGNCRYFQLIPALQKDKLLDIYT